MGSIRNRAGSASGTESKGKEVLNDIAVQSKKGFNAIMQRLGGDKGDKDKEDTGYVVIGSGGEGDGGGLHRRGTARGDPTRGMGTMRGVKVKRDAEEAGERVPFTNAGLTSDAQIRLTDWGYSILSHCDCGGRSSSLQPSR